VLEVAEVEEFPGRERLVPMPHKRTPIEDDAALSQHPAGECDRRGVEHDDIDLVRRRGRP
jgi:hypothetical protein